MKLIKLGEEAKGYNPKKSGKKNRKRNKKAEKQKLKEEAKERKKAAQAEKKLAKQRKKDEKKGRKKESGKEPKDYGSKEQRKDDLEKKLQDRPDEAELLERGVLQKVKNIPIFDAPLGQVMYISYTEYEVPNIVNDAIQYLNEDNRIKLQGLFRVSGGMEEIRTFKDEYDQGNEVKFEGCNPHSVSGLLKLFFRSLPDPLLTYRLYDKFCDSMKQTDTTERTAHVIECVRALPAPNREVLVILMRFLKEVSRHEKDNLMNSQNIGIVFGPTLLKKKSADMMAEISSVPAQVIEFMIDEHDAIFSGIEKDDDVKQKKNHSRTLSGTNLRSMSGGRSMTTLAPRGGTPPSKPSRTLPKRTGRPTIAVPTRGTGGSPSPGALPFALPPRKSPQTPPPTAQPLVTPPPQSVGESENVELPADQTPALPSPLPTQEQATEDKPPDVSPRDYVAPPDRPPPLPKRQASAVVLPTDSAED